ncbi:ComEA family DNA-binding protein [Sulfurihydrogenibium azorense]|uniref:ComEA n=1 Tax=Sulfurihydrogenibium azorense (strain DSM 15241 / OCM 825 / Az-Fu1) TaxID=204536 RepID=C1DVY3_SULAA|nr:helix-hairpin-helix domain-containing protein [Sulfurihydrogenibium azorense]ACN98430.1 comEA [Sulfurihydrogenibium azorense Az-Fu1]MDM7273626.1 helix-hairpin-helix domain-containing protein [Sulfurihydrogenibium azorense]
MKVYEVLIEIQSIGIIVLITLTLIFSYTPLLFKEKSKYSADDLKIDVNKADQTTLEKVPYIGENTASLIIQDRQIRGYYKSIEELKWIRNFEKVKEYLKVQER